MALPSGITTKTLTFSSETGTTGGASALEILVEPSIQGVVWAATGQPVANFYPLVRTVPGVAAVIQFPATDQIGFIDSHGDPVIDWYFKLTVRYLIDGRKVGLRKFKAFRPQVSDPETQDFDLIPSGDIPIYKGPAGPAGLSAYQVAVKNGFVGSETAWLESLTSDGAPAHYEHDQGQPATTWLIHHNFGYRPGGITLIDSTGREFKAGIEHLDANTIRASLSGAQSGTALVS